MTKIIQEIERKFLLAKFPTRIKPDEKYVITQYYSGDIKYRKIICTITGRIAYEKIEKTFVQEGINNEKVDSITEQEYNQELKELNVVAIVKSRFVYNFQNLNFEVDVFANLDIVVCEVELPNLDKVFTFPPSIDRLILDEVTSNKKFSNKHLFKLLNP